MDEMAVSINKKLKQVSDGGIYNIYIYSWCGCVISMCVYFVYVIILWSMCMGV